MPSSACGFPHGEELRRHWLYALSSKTYFCPKYGDRVPNDFLGDSQVVDDVPYMYNEESQIVSNPNYGMSSKDGFMAHTESPFTGAGFSWMLPGAMNAPCLNQTVAHEAFHTAEETTLWRGTGDRLRDGGFVRGQPLNAANIGDLSFAGHAHLFWPVHDWTPGPSGEESADYDTTGLSGYANGCVTCH